MSTTTTSTAPWSFRRRIGRAASPPTWACYEQIPDDYYEDEYSDDDSCSEDDDSYHRDRSDDEQEDHDHHEDMLMDMDVETCSSEDKGSNRDAKGKQRAVDPEVVTSASNGSTHSSHGVHSTSPTRRHRKKERPMYTLRPILTIQKSQGFVWNQDLFVPPYIKDRYIASTSPSNSMGFISSSVSSTNSTLDDYGNYEVEVVEIRVTKDDLNNIIP